MAYERQYKYFVGDFETTTFKGQEYTEVWASAIVPIGSEDVQIFHSIDETFSYLLSLKENVTVYYHNLKFDGYFWLDYLLIKLGYIQALRQKSDKINDVEFLEDYEMPNKSFKYLISGKGQWYNIKIKYNGKIIRFLDSLKIIPFSVKEIGENFQTKHKKLDMEYKGFRYAGCEITKKEREYIANDVLVVKEALELMIRRGHKKTTIGSCCLYEYKRMIDHKEWEGMFPDLRNFLLDEKIYGSKDVESYIRKTYKGGWCYLVKGKENTEYKNGITVDVNSLYPSMMSSESHNRYPIGNPIMWSGNYIPNEAKMYNKYFFIRVKTRFYLKDNKLPTIQIKNNVLYKPTEWLSTSDIYNFKRKEYQRYYYDLDNNLIDTAVIMSLTKTDYELFLEHYRVEDFEILDGCYFDTAMGIFDEYINKYRELKEKSKGAERQLAKLFLNNLYGKMATSPASDFKVAIIKPDETIGFMDVFAKDKTPLYIPVGSAITSYARQFTIRAAQANYYGANKAGFIYADTDSIHCDISADELKGVPIHKTAFCNWKIETEWDKAIFVRQKTYIEHEKEDDNKDETEILDEEKRLQKERNRYIIKCAGMPDKCKNLLQYSLVGYTADEYKKLDVEAKKFVDVKRNMIDFKIGLTVPDKLMPKKIKGGIVLYDTSYEMR